MADQVTAPTLDPFAPGFFENPYAQYAAIRDAGAVHRTLFGPWMLTHWEHVHQLLRDPTTSVEDRNAPESQFSDLFEPPDLGRTRGGDAARGDKAILNIDPPDHTRLRKLVSKAFTPRTVEQLRPRVEALRGRPARPSRRGRRRRPRRSVGRHQRPRLPAALRGHQRDARSCPTRPTRRSSASGPTPSYRCSTRSSRRPTPRRSTRPADHMIEVITDAIAWKRGRLDQRRRPAGGAHPGRGRRRHADRGRAPRQRDAAVHGRPRDHRQPHRQRHQRAPPQPGSVRAARGRPVASTPAAVEELLRYDSPVQISRRIMLQPVTIAGHTFERRRLRDDRARRGQPRPGQVRRRRRRAPPRPRVGPRARVVRQRRAPLPRSGPRPARGPRRDRSPGPPVPGHGSWSTSPPPGTAASSCEASTTST